MDNIDKPQKTNVRYGQIWTDQDWEKLKVYQKEKKTLEEISKTMGRTPGGIQAAQSRLIKMCVEKEGKTVDVVAQELNVTDANIIAKAKQNLQKDSEKEKKTTEKKLIKGAKQEEMLPPSTVGHLIYSGKIEVTINLAGDKYSVIKTDSTQTKVNYLPTMSDLDCISSVLRKLIMQVNPGTEIKLILQAEMDKLLKKITEPRSFTDPIKDSEMICYSMYQTVCSLYKVVK